MDAAGLERLAGQMRDKVFGQYPHAGADLKDRGALKGINDAARDVLVCQEMLAKGFFRSDFHTAKITHFLLSKLDIIR